MATLEFKIGWFGKQADKLEDAADALHDLYCEVQAIQYYPLFEMTPIADAYDGVRNALLTEDNSIAAGRDRYREYAEGIRLTGRNYAEGEAANAAEASQIEIWLQDAGL